jgi:hypothetical protein
MNKSGQGPSHNISSLATADDEVIGMCINANPALDCAVQLLSPGLLLNVCLRSFTFRQILDFPRLPTAGAYPAHPSFPTAPPSCHL